MVRAKRGGCKCTLFVNQISFFWNDTVKCSAFLSPNAKPNNPSPNQSITPLDNIEIDTLKANS